MEIEAKKLRVLRQQMVAGDKLVAFSHSRECAASLCLTALFVLDSLDLFMSGAEFSHTTVVSWSSD